MAAEVTRRDIADGLARLGVAAGDALLVHSSLSAFGWVEGGADAVIDALLESVGGDGTVLLPTHTWRDVGRENPVFDVRKTPGCVGRIPEVFRKREAAYRGLHPTHSCAGIGPMTRDLLRDHETQVTPCGSKSPYQRLMDCGGKIVFLGVTLFVNTSFHALEETACVPWVLDQFEELFTIDHDGDRIRVPSRRHAGGLRRAFEQMEPTLLETGAMVKGTIGEATVRVVESGPMRDVLLPRLAEDPFLFLAERDAERERRRNRQWRHNRRP
jgi:aminoglycoside 3-N-acetyltransferase